jgi:hypothetical protein
MKKLAVLVGLSVLALIIILAWKKWTERNIVIDNTALPPNEIPPSRDTSTKEIPVFVNIDTLNILEGCITGSIRDVSNEADICNNSRVYGEGIQDTISMESFKLKYDVKAYKINRYIPIVVGKEYLIELTTFSQELNDTTAVKFCENWEDLKGQAQDKIALLGGYIKDIAGDTIPLDIKAVKINLAMDLFVNDAVVIQIIPDKKQPDERKSYLLKDYFKWLSRPTNKASVKTEWIEITIISDFQYDEKTGMYKAKGKIKQVYKKLKKLTGPKNKVFDWGESIEDSPFYFDVTYKTIEVFVKKEIAGNEEKCLILLGNVYAESIE